MTPPQPRLLDRTSARVVVVVLLAIALAASLSFQYPFLSNDGPTLAYDAFATAHLDDTARAFSQFVRPNVITTRHGADLVFFVVDAIGGWRAGMHAMHVVAAEAFAFAFFVFVRTLSPRRFAIALLGFPFAIQSPLFHGVLPFIYGTALALVAMSVWLRGETFKHVAIVAALLVLTALCHPFPVGAAGLAFGLVSLVRNDNRGRVRALALLAAASVPAVALSYFGARDESTTGFASVWADVVTRTLLVARNFQPGGAWRPIVALAIAIVGAACALVRKQRIEMALASLGVVFLLLAMALPDDIGSWQLAGERPLPFAFAFLVACIDVDVFSARSPRAQQIATVTIVAVVVAYTASSFAWAAHTGIEVHDATKRVLAGLDRTSPEPRDWLPAITNPDADRAWDISRFEPLFHVADLYAIELGGVTLFTQAYIPAKDPILRTHADRGETPSTQDFALSVARAPDRNARDAEVRKLGAVASTHDGLVYVGDDDDVTQLVNAGFVASYAKDGVLVAHFEGCQGRVVVDDVHAPIDVEVGWWPRRTPQATLHIEPSANETHVEAPLHHFGCGNVWLHAVNARCANTSDPVRATFTNNANADGNTLRCAIVDAK